MDLNFFKDHLFDLINDSQLLCVRDIIIKDREDRLIVLLEDGTSIDVVCSISTQADASAQGSL